MGLAILPCLLTDGDEDLVQLLPPERVISAKLWLVMHRDLNRVPRVRSVMDFIVQVAPKRVDKSGRLQPSAPMNQQPGCVLATLQGNPYKEKFNQRCGDDQESPSRLS